MRFFVALIFCVAAVSATEFRSCSDGKPSADSVQVTGCETLPCDFVRGTDLTAQIDFTAGMSADNMKPLVMVTIAGLTVEYPLDQTDACANLISGGCPLNSGDKASYQLTMPILQEYPPVSMTIEFSLLDQSGAVVTCVELDGKVVS